VPPFGPNVPSEQWKVTAPTPVRDVFDRWASEIPGVSRRLASRPGHGPSYFTREREIAHFHGDRRLDVRLTSAVIRQRLAERSFDARVRVRSPTANWVAVDLEAPGAIPLALDLLKDAVRANA